MSNKSNIIIEQGTTYSLVVDVLDANGASVNIASYTSNAQLRKHYLSNTAIIFETIVGDGHVTLNLSANQTSNLEAGKYMYDVKITSPGGVVTRIVEGIAMITPMITR